MGKNKVIENRQSQPGGPCSEVDIDIVNLKKDTDKKNEVEVISLRAKEGSTEVELLRYIAKDLGVAWGQDENGWWATVPFGPKDLLSTLGILWIKAVFLLFTLIYIINLFVSGATIANRIFAFINISYILQFFIYIIPGIILNEIGEKRDKKKKILIKKHDIKSI